MKGKIIKGIMAVLLVCSISVPLSGCAFVNPDVRENFENWADDFLGGVFGNDDKDDKNEPSTDDSGNEVGENGNENTGTENEGGENGNENTGTENEGGSSTVTPTFESSGEMFIDNVNLITVKPTETTVTVGETFSIVVEKDTRCPITDEPTFGVEVDSESILSVDETGNVTAVGAGQAYVSVNVGSLFYNVNIIVVEEETPDDTYVISATYLFADRRFTVSHQEVKLHKNESFTIEVTTTTTATPTNLQLREITDDSYGKKFLTIDGMTATASEIGSTHILVEWEEDTDYPLLIDVTIIE